MEKYYVLVENTEEEILFDDYVENVPSIEDLKMVIEVSFKPVLGHYYIATKKFNRYDEDCIIYCNY